MAIAAARTMRVYLDHVLALLPFEPAVLARKADRRARSWTSARASRSTSFARTRSNRCDAPPRRRSCCAAREPAAAKSRRMAGGLRRRARARIGTRGWALELDRTHTAAVLPGWWRTQPHAGRSRPRIVTRSAEEVARSSAPARAALSKSGTVTLELALAGCSDRRGLSGVRVRGDDRALDDQRRFRHSRQPRAR